MVHRFLLTFRILLPIRNTMFGREDYIISHHNRNTGIYPQSTPPFPDVANDPQEYLQESLIPSTSNHSPTKQWRRATTQRWRKTIIINIIIIVGGKEKLADKPGNILAG